MIRNAIIRESRIRNDKGQDVYEGVWADDGVTPCTLRVATNGRNYYPYAVDDVVMVALPHGDHTGGRIFDLYEAAQVEPSDDANTEMHARGDGSLRLVAEEGRVDLGKGDPGDQEQVGLHAQLRADIDAVYDLMEPDITPGTGTAFGALLLSIQNQILAGGGGTIAADIATFLEAHAAAAPDSKAADNVYAKAVT